MTVLWDCVWGGAALGKTLCHCLNGPVLRSGGCGAMYEIHIESDEFKGKRTIQQHQLVNQVKYVNQCITCCCEESMNGALLYVTLCKSKEILI